MKKSYKYLDTFTVRGNKYTYFKRVREGHNIRVRLYEKKGSKAFDTEYKSAKDWYSRNSKRIVTNLAA